MKRIITIIAFAILAVFFISSCTGENLRPDQIGEVLLQEGGVTMPDGKVVTLTLEKYRGYWVVSVSGQVTRTEKYLRDGEKHLELYQVEIDSFSHKVKDVFTISENATGEILVGYDDKHIYIWK